LYENLSIIDCKVLYDVTLVEGNVDALISLQSHGTVMHSTMVNCFQKGGFNLNEASDCKKKKKKKKKRGGGDGVELGIAKVDGGQQKTGI
jgi:hypothetical protein